MSSYTFDFITLMLWRLPLLMMWLVGIILAAVYWKRVPRVSALVLIAMAIFMIQALCGDVGTHLLMSQPINAPKRYQLYWASFSVVRVSFQILAFAFLTVAAFMSRDRKLCHAVRPEYTPDESDQPRRSGLETSPDAIREL